MTATASKARQAAAALRLLPPREIHYAAPDLSPDQRAVVSVRQGGGPVLVPGGPGTGKSTVLVESAVRRVNEDGVDPERILILAPGRHAAAALRDTFTGRLDRSLSTTPARTWASYAFDVIRRAKAEGVLPLPRPPKLLSGPEQDLIIKELLEGHSRPGHQLPWPEDLSAALPTRGFRNEVRQLFDRIIEAGRTAEDLVGLAYECGRPDWMAAAELYGEYRDVLDLRMPEAFDPAGIITTARQIFQDSPAFLAAERDRLQLILVDDAQESNPAVFELLADIAEGKDAVVTYSPDTVVQGFRGARPDLVAELPLLLEGSHEVLERPLWITHRHRPEVAEAWTRVAARISQRSGGQRARRLEQPDSIEGAQENSNGGRVEGHVLPSPVHELRYVAQRILEAQLREGREFGDIAVIVRNGGLISQVQRYLNGQGIPVRVPVADSAVRDEVAVRPLLEVFAVILDPAKLTPETAVSLLTSRIGGASAIELRRLRQSLRREELLGGGGRSSDALLVEALLEPGALASLGIEGNPARRLARMIAAGTAAAAEPGANAESVLWALWHATGLASRWSDAALEGGSAGARADRDLDAMMALFHTAERFVDQLPGSGPEQFLDYLLNQELPMDTLAARAQLEECVEIMTPASAAGREWPVVIVAGLQEGVWPNTRLRGELLGSTLFADAVEHGVDYALGRGPLSRLRDIRYDELRSFSTAVSRAKEILICTAVSSEDEQTSAFLDYVAPLAPGDYKRDYTPVDRPMTLRALVAELRQHAQAEDQDDGESSTAREAARVLARLASVDPPVAGAHPDTWWGLAPLSSEEAVVPAGGTVSVSPSKVEAVHKSPLDWFVQAAGGEAATDFARSLGTLVHTIAQELPDASGAQYVAELVRRWPTLGMKDNWEGKLDYQRAELMVRKLAQYVLIMRSEGRSLLAVEHDFEVQLPDVHLPSACLEEGADDSTGTRHAVLRGQVDRLEIDAEGRLVIVDLKTGKRQPGKAEVARHPQLGAYQAAVLKGAFEDAGTFGEFGKPVPGGAVLAQLGTKTKTPGVQQQDPLEPDDNWAEALVNEAAELMAGATFEARHDPSKGGHGGHGCRLPDICPLCARGKQVTE